MTNQGARAGSARLLPALVLLVATTLAVGAARTPAAAQEPPPTDAAALLTGAAEAMSTVTSFHFELTTPQGTTAFMEGLEIRGVAGDVQRPDRFRATVTAAVAFVTVDVQIVGIGPRLWVTDPTAAEERFTEIDTGGQALDTLLNPDRLLLAAVGVVQDPQVTDEEEIDGVPTTRIDGFVDLRQALQAVGEAAEVPATPPPDFLPAEELPITVWLDAEGRVRRLELVGPVIESEDPDVVRRLDLSAFDAPLDIQPPATPSAHLGR